MTFVKLQTWSLEEKSRCMHKHTVWLLWIWMVLLLQPHSWPCDGVKNTHRFPEFLSPEIKLKQYLPKLFSYGYQIKLILCGDGNGLNRNSSDKGYKIMNNCMHPVKFNKNVIIHFSVIQYARLTDYSIHSERVVLSWLNNINLSDWSQR